MDLLGFLFDHLFEILGWVSGIFLLYGLAVVMESQFPARAPGEPKAVVAPEPASPRTQVYPPAYID